MARPGYALYGGNPTPDQDNPMKEVVTVSSPLVQIKHIQKGDTVGYGSVFKAPENMRVGTIALGYADGVFRSFFDKGHVCVNGEKAKILGRVSMDLIVIDLSSPYFDNVKPLDDVEILNKEQTIDIVADACNTIGYEILTHLGLRYQRDYI